MNQQPHLLWPAARDSRPPEDALGKYILFIIRGNATPFNKKTEK
jgi:hypothetical protein